MKAPDMVNAEFRKIKVATEGFEYAKYCNNPEDALHRMLQQGISTVL